MANIIIDSKTAETLNRELGLNLPTSGATVHLGKEGDEEVEIHFGETEAGYDVQTITPTGISMWTHCNTDSEGEKVEPACEGTTVFEEVSNSEKVRIFLATLSSSELAPANKSILTVHAAEIKKYRAIIRGNS